MSDWQPIETAPKDGTHVLLYDHAGAMVLEGYYNDDEWCRANLWHTDEDSLVMEPHYWMPLPDPPVGAYDSDRHGEGRE